MATLGNGSTRVTWPSFESKFWLTKNMHDLVLYSHGSRDVAQYGFPTVEAVNSVRFPHRPSVEPSESSTFHSDSQTTRRLNIGHQSSPSFPLTIRKDASSHTRHPFDPVSSKIRRRDHPASYRETNLGAMTKYGYTHNLFNGFRL